MTEPVFGISFQREDNEPRPAVESDLSTVGIVGIAEGADPIAFPLNTPVLIYTSDAVNIPRLGPLAADNTIRPALEGIAQQLGEFQVAAKCIVVRVAKGAGADETAKLWATIANLVGSAVTRTGINALTLAGPRLGVIPRLITVPGFTSQQKTGVSSIAVTAAGDNYTAETTTVTIAAPGGAGGVQATAVPVITAGKLTGITITNPGEGYTAVPVVTIADTGTGAGGAATASIAPLANPVCAALPAVLNKLVAHAVVAGPGTTEEAETNWRETLQSERLIPITPMVTILAPDGSNMNVAAEPYILGIGVRRDFEFNGRPFHSWANQPVYGIQGPSRPIEFSITDGAVEGQSLLAKNIGVIVRGEQGMEDAIASGGFVFVGTDNAGEDDNWRFYNVTRGRDFIHLMFLRTLRFYLGRFNLTGQTIQSVVNTMKLALRDLEADGDILPGFDVGFTPDKNLPTELRKGKFFVRFACEEAPVFRHLTIGSARRLKSLELMVEDLVSTLDQMAA